jgi:tetratricopeptide (TPR) repeat protein
MKKPDFGDSRTVRVFLSSTFRDFMEERDLLVRKVFPELRRRCRLRQVELVEVDLRWGITEQEAQQGKVLPICLAEIDRARPFFMGLLGERYGWVPETNQYDLSLILEQPWLEEHRGGKSVTELEILHGVLNNPAMKNRAFFYLRDPRWAEKRGGAYLGEGPTEKAKLAELKAQIRQSGFPVVENYPHPKALAERVQQDLWKLIDEAYPESEVPDALALERRRHEAYGATRRGLYLGGERYFDALDQTMRASPFHPVLVTGQSGGGKSALLANWVTRWGQAHHETPIIVHHLGCGADAADPVKMVVRLIQEMARITGDEPKLERDPEKQLEQLPIQLAMAGAWAERNRRELLLVLDGLDKVSDRKNLLWFPSILPAGVKMVASCLEGEILKAVQGKLTWQTLGVEPFGKEEQASFIREYLGRYRKSLTSEQTEALQGFPLSGNPLFLLTVLEELRVFGVHEELEKRLKTLLSPPPSKKPGEEPTVDDVFEHVLGRLEQDLGKKPVQRALESIWGSRSGLYDDEFLGLTGLAPAQWAEMRNAVDESLYESSGKINFGHDYLRKAVEDRYGLIGKKRLGVHKRLAEWFERREVNARVAEELPWQWKQAEEKAGLTRCLLRREVFEYTYEKDAYELLFYWLWTKKSIEPSLKLLWKKQKNLLRSGEAARLASFLGGFLKLAGIFTDFTRTLHIFAVKKYESVFGKAHPDAQAVLEGLGNLLMDIGDYSGSERVHRCILNRRKGSSSNQRILRQSSYTNIANALFQKGHLHGAKSFFSKALAGYKASYGINHPDTCMALNNLGIILEALGDLSEARRIFKLALDARRALLGPCHPETLASINSLANLHLGSGEHDQAEALHRKAYDGRKASLGMLHPDTLISEMNVAIVLRYKKRFAESESFYKRALNGLSASLGINHAETLRCMFNLGNLLADTNRIQESERIHTKVLISRSKRLGQLHPDTLSSFSNLGVILIRQKKYAKAKPLFQKAFDGRRKLLGLNHQDTINSIQHLGTSLKRTGEIKAAVNLLRQSSKKSRACFLELRYNLSCYECLAGNFKKALKLLVGHLKDFPEQRDQALNDEDLIAIRPALLKIQI